ncbi:Zn-dependent protease [Paenibacillus darwinianus]|uniref:Zn-dependent protease n=1 Tax=Paenibacillus darwinianus TaxID=1380763 RepID=A0A9W5RZ06_9BACL|nr:M50 family metallopeptidase [Paenibacillus darwinianus]EXX85142.1 Zn-dependent protease [Paenibacillus darwinianus]EXX90087.1 Zn-dependent protease [Paenibacillus darwinianus]EXX91309.1 Zn-dependent protease [Paenibacillus darwinianus]
MINWLGIRWNVHPLFVLVMLGSVVTGYLAELIVLFAIVLVHEFGHVAAAKALGWRVREIKLLPFGGVAETEEAGTVSAAEEAWVAAAGPLQNAWMAAAAWALGRWAGWDEDWAAYIVRANIMIGLFNLLPVLPLDGGKLLQAAIGGGFSYYRTLQWGAALSLVFSAGMIVYAWLPLHEGGIQLNLFTIGLFLFVSNWTYRRNLPYVFLRFLMSRNAVSEASRERGTPAEPIVVTGRQTIGGILRMLRRGHYHLIYVTGEGGRLLGVLPEERIIERYLEIGRQGAALSELFP